MLCGDTSDDVSKRSIVLGLQVQVADRIVSMSVEARTEENELRFETRGEGVKLGFSFPQHFFSRCVEAKREIQGGPQSLPRAGFITIACTRVKRRAMDREESNLGVIVKRVLSTITMVNVKIDDHQSVKLFGRQSVASCDGDIIEKTKTHRARLDGMVSRGARHAKRGFVLSGDHLRGCLDGSPRCKTGNVERLR